MLIFKRFIKQVNIKYFDILFYISINIFEKYCIRRVIKKVKNRIAFNRKILEYSKIF